LSKFFDQKAASSLHMDSSVIFPRGANVHSHLIHASLDTLRALTLLVGWQEGHPACKT